MSLHQRYVVKRQLDIWLDLDIANERKGLLKLDTKRLIPRSDFFLMRVTSLQRVCAVIYNVRHTAPNLVRVRRCITCAKVPENNDSGRKEELLCHAARVSDRFIPYRQIYTWTTLATHANFALNQKRDHARF